MIETTSLVQGTDYEATLREGTAVFRGTLFALNDLTLVLLEPDIPKDWLSIPPPARPSIGHHVHILRIDQIKKIRPLSRSNNNDDQNPGQVPLPQITEHLNPQKMARRAERALRERISELGALAAPPGTSEEAQAIFIALSRTYDKYYFFRLPLQTSLLMGPRILVFSASYPRNG